MFILLVVGFTQSLLAQLQAPEPRPEEEVKPEKLIFAYPAGEIGTIYVIQGSNHVKVSIPESIKNVYSAEDIVYKLSKGEDTILDAGHRLTWVPDYKLSFPVFGGKRIEIKHFFNRKSFKFEKVTRTVDIQFTFWPLMGGAFFFFVASFFIGTLINTYKLKKKRNGGMVLGRETYSFSLFLICFVIADLGIFLITALL
jgi:hypothetical protein